jgi:DNA-binding winged helix-turn-helix (wHTH) protein
MLDSRTRRLLRDGEVHLSPKAFDLLFSLVENRSRAMSRADLQATLWPSTFAAQDNKLLLEYEILRDHVLTSGRRTWRWATG